MQSSHFGQTLTALLGQINQQSTTLWYNIGFAIIHPFQRNCKRMKKIEGKVFADAETIVVVVSR